MLYAAAAKLTVEEPANPGDTHHRDLDAEWIEVRARSNGVYPPHTHTHTLAYIHTYTHPYTH